MPYFLLITIINSSSYRISNLIFSGKGIASLGFGNCISTISQFFILNEGNGDKPKQGSNVSVHYSGFLLDGTKFDSSYDRGEPITFPLGAGRVIKGWDEGISLLNVGGKAKFIIPPDLGYGSRAMGPIPANSVLIFEVELVDISK